MRQTWSNILVEQIDCILWKDLRGNFYKNPRSKMYWDSCMKCITFHILTVFCNDTAKAQRYNISNCLKKPNWVPIRHLCITSSS